MCRMGLDKVWMGERKGLVEDKCVDGNLMKVGGGGGIHKITDNKHRHLT